MEIDGGDEREGKVEKEGEKVVVGDVVVKENVGGG
jgi:hypothetical protein